jgi:hypothetical protein
MADSSFAAGDRAVIVVDVPEAGLKAGELVWIKSSAAEQVNVLHADGRTAGVVRAEQLRSPSASDVASAAGIRQRKPPPEWLKKSRPFVFIALLILTALGWRHWNRESPLRREPVNNQIQEGKLPADRELKR